METLSDLRKQAKYIDGKIALLERKLEYPSLIYNSDNVQHAESLLGNLISENNNIMDSISEEKEKGKHNSNEMQMFLDTVNAETQRMINYLHDIEKQLEQYGYKPMSPQQQEEELEPQEESIATVEENLEGTYIVDLPEESLPKPKFSKHYYITLGLPIPPGILEASNTETM